MNRVVYKYVTNTLESLAFWQSNPISGEGGKNTCAPLFHQIIVGRQQEMTTLLVCKFHLVYQKRLKQKKFEIFSGNPPFWPLEKISKP